MCKTVLNNVINMACTSNLSLQIITEEMFILFIFLQVMFKNTNTVRQAIMLATSLSLVVDSHCYNQSSLLRSTIMFWSAHSLFMIGNHLVQSIWVGGVEGLSHLLFHNSLGYFSSLILNQGCFTCTRYFVEIVLNVFVKSMIRTSIYFSFMKGLYLLVT